MFIKLSVALLFGAIQFSMAFLAPSPQTSSLHPTPRSGLNLQILASKQDFPDKKEYLKWIKFRENKPPVNPVQEVAEESMKPPPQKYDIKTREELDDYWQDKKGRFRNYDGEIDYNELLKCARVVGDTQIIGSKEHPERTHPVAQLMHARKRNNSTCMEGPRPDGCRVALSIEGGGMRGCVSAGMVAAIYYLGLQDTIDVVYGSSAGGVIGSYFVTRQVQWLGPEIYYDSLTMPGKSFIDSKRLLRAMGFGLLDPRQIKDTVYRRRDGKPVLNLDYLLKETVQQTKQLDWDKFVEMQRVQPLKIAASGLKSEKAILMSYENGNFETLDELTRCMHASCLLPGIAGPVMNMDKSAVERGQTGKKFVLGNGLSHANYEPMADSLIYQPLPFHSALEEGATHVLVLRTRADGADVTGKSSLFERLIVKRFFMRKNNLPNMWERMRKHLHKKRYAEDVITLNEAAWDDRDPMDVSSPHLMAIAMPPGSEEISKLETRREEILNGVRRGFARAYDALVEDPLQRGRGAIIAKEFFPDEILNYDPSNFNNSQQSAFEVFLRKSGEDPEAWKAKPLPTTAPSEEESSATTIIEQ
jgi:predicted acylesterase/phospholipase RssA